MKQYLLGIDNGGTVIKCAVYDLSGRELAVKTERVPLIARPKMASAGGGESAA